MSNKQIAVNWAREQVEAAAKRGTIVLSDEFFKPFNDKTRKRVCEELLSSFKILAWPVNKNGAMLCYVNDPRLTIKDDGTYRAGIWCNEETAQIIAFPALPLK